MEVLLPRSYSSLELSTTRHLEGFGLSCISVPCNCTYILCLTFLQGRSLCSRNRINRHWDLHLQRVQTTVSGHNSDWQGLRGWFLLWEGKVLFGNLAVASVLWQKSWLVLEVSFPLFGRFSQCQYRDKKRALLLSYESIAFLISLMFCCCGSIHSHWNVTAKRQS